MAWSSSPTAIERGRSALAAYRSEGADIFAGYLFTVLAP
jgi:hypothetical protein